MDAGLYRDSRNLNSITFGDLIDRYTEEIGAVRPFGKNKTAALKSLSTALGAVFLSGPDAERLDKYHADFGQVCRHTVTPEMLEAA
jgi:hypothetical protein